MLELELRAFEVRTHGTPKGSGHALVQPLHRGWTDGMVGVREWGGLVVYKGEVL